VKSHLFLLILMSYSHLICRTVYRTKDVRMPKITTQWENDTKTYQFKNTHLEQEPLFKVFDKQHFLANQLPTNAISFRTDQSHSVSGSTLARLIEGLLEEVKKGKSNFTHFDVLKKRDFNKKTQVGLLVVKFKKYPFVVKLFMETPESFVQPFSKGFEPICFFYMGGGVNRHISGFTRIKNLNHVKKTVMAHPYWSQKVDFPRKWFWQPRNNRWITLKGKHIGSGPCSTSFPATYAIVADQIVWSREFQLFDSRDRKRAMALSNLVDQRIDPHINNFGIEQKTGKIVPIDFELFPLMVGLKQGRKSSGYLAWYTGLACKMIKDTFGRSKQERKNLQNDTILSYLQDEP